MIMILINAHPHSGLPGTTLDGLCFIQDHVLPLHTLKVLHILHHLHTHTINSHFVWVYLHTQAKLCYQLVACDEDVEWSVVLVEELLQEG